MEYAIKLSPYAKIFYNEWLLAPESSTYNISIDQIFYGNLDVNHLKKALKRYIAEHVLLNSHIQEIDEEPHWVKNNAIKELEYSDNLIDKSELLNYVTNSFNLYTGPLYRFKLIRINSNIHRFIAIFYRLYDERTVNKELLNNFINSYKKLFIEALADLTQNNTIKQIVAYNLLNEKQYQQLVYEFNQTEKDCPQNKTIHELFEEQVCKMPNNIAVMHENTKLTILLKKLRAK